MPRHQIDRVVVINDASVARGGATGLALQLARLLSARGIPVTYFCGDGGDPTLTEAGINVVAVGGERLATARGAASVSALWNRRAAALLSSFVAAHDTPRTVYHVHGWAQILSPAIFRELRPVAARTVIHAHDFFLACPNGAYAIYPTKRPCPHRPLSGACLTTNCDKRSSLHKGWRVLRQSLLRYAFMPRAPWAAIAMIHPAMRPLMARAGYPEALLTTVRNPAEPFSATRIPAEANQRLVFVGRLEPDKGARELVAAAKRAEMPLTLVGDGPLRAELRAEHPDVTVTGWRERAEIGPLVQDARALVMPSLHPEPFGLVAAEASRAGLPVVVSDTALIAAEVTERGLGVSVDVHDPEAFAETLAEIRDLPKEDIAAMSQRGASGTAPLAQSLDAWMDQLLALYDTAMSPKR